MFYLNTLYILVFSYKVSHVQLLNFKWFYCVILLNIIEFKVNHLIITFKVNRILSTVSIDIELSQEGKEEKVTNIILKARFVIHKILKNSCVTTFTVCRYVTSFIKQFK